VNQDGYPALMGQMGEVVLPSVSDLAITLVIYLDFGNVFILTVFIHEMSKFHVKCLCEKLEDTRRVKITRTTR
jgi:hypothetical protein